jgi:hypothetical protein
MKNPTEAAIRLADGKVFVGSFHGHALEKASELGYSDQVLGKAELGFSHSDGSSFCLAGMTLLVGTAERCV